MKIILVAKGKISWLGPADQSSGEVGSDLRGNACSFPNSKPCRSLQGGTASDLMKAEWVTENQASASASLGSGFKFPLCCSLWEPWASPLTSYLQMGIIKVLAL